MSSYYVNVSIQPKRGDLVRTPYGNILRVSRYRKFAVVGLCRYPPDKLELIHREEKCNPLHSDI